jgi:hypothetical protein
MPYGLSLLLIPVQVYSLNKDSHQFIISII